jgi:hypothetical protein
MSSSLPKVAIVVLNWNGRDDTIECLRSLEVLDYSNQRVIVVDNSSSDGSVGALRRNCDNVELIENSTNLGFAEGNNVGIRRALLTDPAYVLLLNNDTVCSSDFLSRMIDFMEGNRDVGLCNPVQYSYNDRETILAAGGTLNFVGQSSLNAQGLKDMKLGRPFETTYASGACLLIRGDLLRALGFLDGEMYFGAEDVDISLRFWIAGYRIVVVPDSIIFHKHSVSVSRMPNSWRVYFSVRSRIRMMIKNLQWRTNIVAIPVCIMLQLLSIAIDLCVRRDYTIASSRIRAIGWNFTCLRSTCVERINVQARRKNPDRRFLNLVDWRNSISVQK